MSYFKEIVLKWNDVWRYDYWFRKKYNIHFNSEEHRSLNQIDIKFCFVEHILASEEEVNNEIREKQLKIYNETGDWLRDRKLSKEKEDALFDLIDIDKL
jgi:hypothetical protein